MGTDKKGDCGRFAAYVGELTKVIEHADRRGTAESLFGASGDGGRRSVEPMAAVTAPARVSAQHQKLLHFVAECDVVGSSRCWPKCASWWCRR